MAYTHKIIHRVRSLRAKGKTYSEISREIKIKIPKSTLSNWCEKVSLPIWYAEKIQTINKKNFSKALKIAWAVNKLKRERFLRSLLADKGQIVRNLKNKAFLKSLLAVLYLGEGTKWKSHAGLVLGSSDPTIIILYIRLLHICYGINLEQLRCRVSYRADQNIHALQKYWSRITSIPLKNFYKTIPDPRTVGKPTKRKDYMGVCVISCAGTHIQLELEMIPKVILEGL